MKKKVLGLFIALIMLAAMGYAYSAVALLDADDPPPYDDWTHAFVYNTTVFDPVNYTTIPTTTTEWTGTDAYGNPVPQTTALPRFTNRPPRTQPNHIPWRPFEHFFHYDGGEVLSRDWVCYECAGLDYCVHWLYYRGVIASLDELDNQEHEGYVEAGPAWEFRYYTVVRDSTPFALNWFSILLAVIVLLAAIAAVLWMVLRTRREAATAAVMPGQSNNFVQDDNAPPQEESAPQDAPAAEDASAQDVDTDLPDEDMTFSED
ncbi:MAG: hypothetical protein FWB76_02705 [Oscillospiraceae bacterium]|nr:hypothetical protein [Oscillospiraceae bacterium]